MTELVPGVGWLARSPKRLTLRTRRPAYGPQANQALDTLTSTVLTARLLYGGMGACPQGNVTLVDAPPGWTADGLDNREVYLDLESEQGQHTVYRAVLSEAVRDGRLTSGTLSGVHLVDVDGPAIPGANPLASPLFAGMVGIGIQLVSAALADLGKTRRDVIEAQLNGLPEADWGAHPNGVAIVGLPTSSTPVQISRDLLGRQYGELTAARYNRTPYVTHTIFQPGAPYATVIEARQNLNTRPLLPRRMMSVSADPVLVKAQQAVTASPPAGPIPADGVARTYNNWQLAGNTPHIIPVPQSTSSSRPVGARITIPYTLTGLTPGPGGNEAGLYVTIRTEPTSIGTQKLISLTPVSRDLALTLEFEYGLDELAGATEIWVYLAPAQQSTAEDMTLRVDPITARFDIEQVNFNGLVAPLEMLIPPYVGPFRELTLYGCWLVPPAFDSDLQQYASGAEVIWQRETATTRVFLGPLPYLGQTRGGR